MSAATSLHPFAPMAPAGEPRPIASRPDDGAPQNLHELRQAMVQRFGEGRLTEGAAAAPLAAAPLVASEPAGPSEAECRTVLARAISVRDQAQADLIEAERAVEQAKRIEAEATAAAAGSVAVELQGADDLARRIVAWTAIGGDRPDLSPDAVSLDARRAGDVARVHAEAARQAVATLTQPLAEKRGAVAQAEQAVQIAAASVVAAMLEDVARAGEQAERAFRQAQMASRAVTEHCFSGSHPIPSRVVTRRLGQVGYLAPLPVTPLSGEPQRYIAAWSDLLNDLRTNADASLTEAVRLGGNSAQS